MWNLYMYIGHRLNTMLLSTIIFYFLEWSNSTAPIPTTTEEYILYSYSNAMYYIARRIYECRIKTPHMNAMYR